MRPAFIDPTTVTDMVVVSCTGVQTPRVAKTLNTVVVARAPVGSEIVTPVPATAVPIRLVSALFLN